MVIKLPQFSAVRARVMRILRPSTKLGRTTLWLGGLSVLLTSLSWITGSAPESRLAGGAAFVTFVFAFCAMWLTVRWARGILHPSTRLARTTLWLGGLSVLFLALQWIGSGSGWTPSGWAMFFTVVFALCAVWLTSRWALRHLLWRLRHRLIVTYIFIGVIPIMLLLLMAGVGGYLLAGQFATYIVTSNLQSELQHLEAANDALAAQLSTLERSGRLNEQIAGEFATVSGENFPQRSVTVWRGDKGLILSTGSALLDAGPAKVPEVIKGNFSGFVIDRNSLHLRAVNRYDEVGLRLTVISNVPITPELLQPATSRLGSVTFFPPDRAGDFEFPSPAKASPIARQRVYAGRVPPPVNQFDRTLRFFTLFNTVDWKTGKSQTGAISVGTRPSMLYSTLFATLGDKAKILLYGLLAIAFFFGLIELVALYIGMRLSRSMTLAVAELYSATEHVNRGDLAHRIPVRSRDQMAALEQSFNSMTESLAKLVAEQKEKQRLESELAIAYDVQDLLFPHKFPGLASLEVYGVCRPARSVSGDYYDFIPLGTDRLVLAVGDISGKGISAALLMATVHAFVRAYSLEPDMVLTPVASGSAAFSEGEPRMYYRGDGISQSQLAPGMLMTTLNYQLFRSTPAEKYATMFLGCYDAAARELKYSNAGHLPPIVLRANGEVARLETSGTVVGLFDGATYDESTIAMQPGDIFVAFTDGVTEPENESGEFGEERLIELIQEHRDQPLARIGEVVTGSVAKWIGGAEQPDDVTVVLARAR